MTLTENWRMGVTMDKLYIIHYYYLGTDPWKNIMALPEKEAFRVAAELAAMHPDATSFVIASNSRQLKRNQGITVL